MGLHLIVALAKLKLASATTHGCTPMVANTLILPFLVKIACSLRLINREDYLELLRSSRLFMFRLMQIIALDCDTPIPHNNHLIRTNNAAAAASYSGINGTRRWERAVRLISESVTRARRYFIASLQQHEYDRANLHEFSMAVL